ncbi:MAG: hypothetical protein HY744_22145 [Deltaproteobacteria bacterium]|nr:hypothetical protein [Deltaproteobacteria bacterium]
MAGVHASRGPVLGLALLLALLGGPRALGAEPVAPDGGGADAGAEAALPLPEIPPLEPVALPVPAPAAVEAVEGRLAQLLAIRSAGPLDPQVDLRFLTSDLEPGLVPAIAQKLGELRQGLDGTAAQGVLDAARKAGSRALARQERSARKQRDAGAARVAAAEGDWLRFVLGAAGRRGAAWQQTVQLYGMLRLLEAIGTTPAVRQMLACHAYFGELVRIDLQRAVGRLGDRAVPALIEATGHDAPKVARFARQELDALGRAIPGEAVSIGDPALVAEVLRAYGRTRDVDAARVVLSFSNSDHAALRRAAREAIGAIGEPAAWLLRESYQSLTGSKPPRSWPWDRLARELMRLHDRGRLAGAYQRMEEGTRAAKERRFSEAVAAFDRVLALAPLFERRAEMAPSYVAWADALVREGKRAEAIAAYRKALLLDPALPERRRIESLIALLDAEALAEAGTPDRFLLQRALEIDPANERARERLSALDRGAREREARTKRWVVAAAVGVVAAAALIALGWPGRRRRARPAPDAAPGDTPKPGK